MPNLSEEIFIIKKIKNNVPWTCLINDLDDEEIVGTFCENELQGTRQIDFRIENVIKKKGGKLYVQWKGYNNSFNSWIEVDLSNYATEDDIKNITHVDTSSFALKTNLSNLKTVVDKLDIDKLKSLPNNLSNWKTKVDKLDINN